MFSFWVSFFASYFTRLIFSTITYYTVPKGVLQSWHPTVQSDPDHDDESADESDSSADRDMDDDADAASSIHRFAHLSWSRSVQEGSVQGSDNDRSDATEIISISGMC